MQIRPDNVETRAQAQNIMVYCDLFVELDALKVEMKGECVRLTGKEFALLKFFLLNCGVVSTKQQILDALYVDEEKPEVKIVDVFICKLRGKLAKASEGRTFIETIWGKGYMLPKPERAAASA